MTEADLRQALRAAVNAARGELASFALEDPAEEVELLVDAVTRALCAQGVDGEAAWTLAYEAAADVLFASDA